jgi:hypothetical protein
MDWTSLLYLLGAALMLWLTYRSVRAMPNAFTKEKFFKSSFVLAILTLGLIAFIGILLLLLRQG